MGKILLLCFVTSSLFAQPDSVVLQLAQSEREFSKTALLKGIKSAFLTFLDDQSVLFRPYSVNGKEHILAGPETPGFLTWFPTVVEVSASGDFGYTTGPWEYRKEKLTDEPLSYGHFVSVWKKNSEGKWKVILDVGNKYLKQNIREEKLRINQLSQQQTNKVTSANAERVGMLHTDSAFADVAGKKGNSAAFREFASEDVRVYRNGTFPTQGKKNGLQLVQNEKAQHYSFYAGQISSSGDLGFTYGSAISAGSDTSNYVRIWRKESEWKVVLDVMIPVSKPK